MGCSLGTGVGIRVGFRPCIRQNVRRGVGLRSKVDVRQGVGWGNLVVEALMLITRLGTRQGAEF